MHSWLHNIAFPLKNRQKLCKKDTIELQNYVILQNRNLILLEGDTGEK